MRLARTRVVGWAAHPSGFQTGKKASQDVFSDGTRYMQRMDVEALSHEQ